MSTPLPLRQTEAIARADQLDVTGVDVRLDLDRGTEEFGSVTTLRFESTGGETFLDLRPLRVNELRLNGEPIPADALREGRLPLHTAAGSNELYADVVMAYRTDGEGLHRSVDPADGRHYVYGMSFMNAAPTVFACFDQPDLKAPYTLHVTAPRDWIVVGNAPGQQVEPGVWELETSQPLSTYFVTLVAGPYHLITDEHDGIPLGLSCRASIAEHLDADADEIFTLTRQCFDEFHRLFGIRYPFGNYHQAFVPEFNAGAMENPGCVTFRDPLVFTSRVTRVERIRRASTIAHEMAHQWFGDLTTPRWWDDLWLNESFAEYLGNRVTADVTRYDDVWTHNAYARRQWGLTADLRPTTHPVAGNGAEDAVLALQNFDGISYAKGSSILKQLNATIGDEVFFAGAVDHFTRARFGNATMHDLFASWERAGAGDLSAFTEGWLRTAGPDTLRFDRASGTVQVTPPAPGTGSGADADPPGRRHRMRVAVAEPGAGWTMHQVDTAEQQPIAASADAAVVIDPFEDTWAVSLPDETTASALPVLLRDTPDAQVRAGIWDGVRSALHDATLDPAVLLRIVEAAVPAEDNEDAIGTVLPWAIGRLAPLSADPADALRRVQATAQACTASAPAGSTLQLAAFRSVIDSAADAASLQAWLDGRDLPEGLALDTDLRWKVLVRLASLGGIDRAGLDDALADEPTARTRVEHARAVASMPTAEAKAWAWERFLGNETVPNYELEATALGMWRHGQADVLAPYVDRYFADLPGTAGVRSGWLLADAAVDFFPLTALDEDVVRRAVRLAADESLEASMRRKVADMADELARRVAVVTRYGVR